MHQYQLPDRRGPLILLTALIVIPLSLLMMAQLDCSPLYPLAILLFAALVVGGPRALVSMGDVLERLLPSVLRRPNPKTDAPEVDEDDEHA